MKPSIGRIVHFVQPDGVHCAAVISAVKNDQEVILHVMHPYPHNRHGLEPVTRVLSTYDEYGRIPESWHWPEQI